MLREPTSSCQRPVDQPSCHIDSARWLRGAPAAWYATSHVLSAVECSFVGAKHMRLDCLILRAVLLLWLPCTRPLRLIVSTAEADSRRDDKPSQPTQSLQPPTRPSGRLGTDGGGRAGSGTTCKPPTTGHAPTRHRHRERVRMGNSWTGAVGSR